MLKNVLIIAIILVLITIASGRKHYREERHEEYRPRREEHREIHHEFRRVVPRWERREVRHTVDRLERNGVSRREVHRIERDIKKGLIREHGGYVPTGNRPAHCDCYGWSVYKCGPHSVTAQACRDRVVTECSIRCPAEDFSDCNGWSVQRCTNIPTFIGTWCRTIVAAQCNARAQGLQPSYVPERCDCYGQSLYHCGPHSVTNLDCRQKFADKCAKQCLATQADCADCNAFSNARCSDVPTYVGGTCRNTVVTACQQRCAALAAGTAGGAAGAAGAEQGPKPASGDCYGWSVYKCGPHSVTAQACRDRVVTECSIRCPAEDFSDCNGWSVQRCTNVPTFIGTWCRTIVAAQCTARGEGLQPNYVPDRCDCYGWSLYKCGPHSVTAQDCRNRVSTECSIRCPAQDFSDCNAWSNARCSTVPTFVGTWCRTIVAAQCTARAQGLQPSYVPERCDCYGQSLYKCGPHSVTNLDCRQKLADKCARECPATHADCADCNAFSNARCSDVPTYVGGTCRSAVLTACQQRCAA